MQPGLGDDHVASRVAKIAHVDALDEEPHRLFSLQRRGEENEEWEESEELVHGRD